MNSQREAFEKVFPVPEGCFWNGDCYLSHNVHNYNDMRDANDQNMRLEVWQAATEQGVGEAVTALCRQVFADHPECNTDWEDHRPIEIGSETYNHRMQSKGWEVLAVYTHPPKPTGGGVPDEVMARIKNLLLALGHQGVTLNPDEPPYDVGEWGIKEAQELYDLLATQQPPEQE